LKFEFTIRPQRNILRNGHQQQRAAISCEIDGQDGKADGLTPKGLK
jgi:hypothetical protein